MDVKYQLIKIIIQKCCLKNHDDFVQASINALLPYLNEHPLEVNG